MAKGLPGPFINVLGLINQSSDRASLTRFCGFLAPLGSTVHHWRAPTGCLPVLSNATILEAVTTMGKCTPSRVSFSLPSCLSPHLQHFLSGENPEVALLCCPTL